MKHLYLYALLYMFSYSYANPSAFFSHAHKKATTSAERLAEKNELDPEIIKKASYDASIIAQSALNVGINQINHDFQEIIRAILKQYEIKNEFIDDVVKGVLSGVQKNESYPKILAQASEIKHEVALKASYQTIACYAIILASGAHPLIAEKAAQKAASIDHISESLAQRMAQAAATDAGILAKNKNLIDIIHSITSKRVKKIVKEALLQKNMLKVLCHNDHQEGIFLCCLNKDGKMYTRTTTDGKWELDTNEFTAFPEKLSSFSINDRGIAWATTVNGTILFRDGATIHDNWVIVPGSAKQIVINNNNRVWMISTDGTIYYRTGIQSQKLEGDTWTMIMCDSDTSIKNALSIALNQCDEVVAIGNGGKAYFRKNTHKNPQGTNWREISLFTKVGELETLELMPLREIVLNSRGEIWALSNNNKIFFRDGTSCDQKEGLCWQQIEGALVTMTLAPDSCLWGIDTKSHIFMRAGCMAEKPGGSAWQHILQNHTFKRLFFSGINLQNTAQEYKADKSRRDTKRVRQEGIISTEKQIKDLQKLIARTVGYPRVALKAKLNRFKNLQKAHYLAIKKEVMKVKEAAKQKKLQAKAKVKQKKLKRKKNNPKINSPKKISPNNKIREKVLAISTPQQECASETYSVIPEDKRLVQEPKAQTK